LPPIPEKNQAGLSSWAVRIVKEPVYQLCIAARKRKMIQVGKSWQKLVMLIAAVTDQQSMFAISQPHIIVFSKFNPLIATGTALCVDFGSKMSKFIPQLQVAGTVNVHVY
jgi:hypothetical protein